MRHLAYGRKKTDRLAGWVFLFDQLVVFVWSTGWSCFGGDRLSVFGGRVAGRVFLAANNGRE